MAESSKLFKAMVEAAMCMNCASNDFHCMHFNMQGPEFDTMHADVLKKYYEQAADDFDELSEKACMFKTASEGFPNANGAMEISGYTSWDGQPCIRDIVVARCNDIFETICKCMTQIFIYCNKQDDACCIGVANYLAGRLEYWSKEQHYFNAHRGAQK